MDEWREMFINMILNGVGQQRRKEEPAGIRLKNSHKLVQSNTKMKTVTYTEIQEGEFEEIEDTETGEASVGELENQAADRGEEILDNKADKS